MSSTVAENPAPKLYDHHKLSKFEQQARNEHKYNLEIEDPYDELQIFELIRHLNDPEYPLTLQQLNVVNLERCYLYNNDYVEVHYTPTIPHCSMAQIIGLMIKVKLIKYLPKNMKIMVRITNGTHIKEHQINKQINDKERIAAAVQNPNILRILKRGFYNSDRFSLEDEAKI